MTFISKVGVILIHFYGRRGFRSRTGSTRDYFQRERSHARCDWTTNGLSRGVTETGSAPQVPGYRWIHLSFLFHKPPFPFLCYFINLFLVFIIPRRIKSPQISIFPIRSFPPSNRQQFIFTFTNFNSISPSLKTGSRKQKEEEEEEEEGEIGGPEAFVAKWSSREGRVINPADNAIDSGDIKMIYRPRLIVQYFMHAYKLRPAGFASGR